MAQAAVGGLCYHVINRGNARGEVFHKPEDYAAFCRLLQEAADRVRREKSKGSGVILLFNSRG